MIKYASGSFGFQILFRLHGSAVFKSLTPAAISAVIYIFLYQFAESEYVNCQEISVQCDTTGCVEIEQECNNIFVHPYPMGALVSALTFLLAFRANFSYNRYWDAISALHQMHSKWLDVGMELAAFHLQSEHYPKPPAFGSHPDLKSIERERERLNVTTLEELEEKLLEEKQNERQESMKKRKSRDRLWRPRLSFRGKRKSSKKQNNEDDKVVAEPASGDAEAPSADAESGVQREKDTYAEVLMRNFPLHGHVIPPVRPITKSINAVSYDPVARYYQRQQQHIGTLRQYFPFATRHPGRSTLPETKTTIKTVRKSNPSSQDPALKNSCDHETPMAWDPDMPPLFLQELAHLLSLLSAVAFSTLRNDLEQADSPLIGFKPGMAWPHVDPDEYGAAVRKEWDVYSHRSLAIFRYIFGLSRTPYSRTLYNAARPFRVIGGVSDAEIELLQAARGPMAKVALCTMWVQEYITREYLAGSTGRVAPPIISRLYQFLSDGMIGYNQARKVAYIPFPFPHAQITTLFVLVVVCLMPVLMLSYLGHLGFGLVMNTMTVMCFSGLHEVARELESPFINAPNDIPCNYFQAQFNEALMTIFTGYHPDSYWEVCETVAEPSEVSESNSVSMDEDQDLMKKKSSASFESMTGTKDILPPS